MSEVKSFKPVSVVSYLPQQPRINEDASKKKASLHECFMTSHANKADKFFYGKGDFGWMGRILNVFLVGIPIGIVKLKEFVSRSDCSKEIMAEEIARQTGITPEKIEELKSLKSSDIEQIERDLISVKDTIKSNGAALFRNTSATIELFSDSNKTKVIVEKGVLLAENSQGQRTEIMSRQDFAVYVIYHKLLNDLSYADLSDLDLSDLDMSSFNFEGANLKNTKLDNAILTDSNFASAQYSTETTFTHAKLDNAWFGLTSNLEGVSFRGASLREVILRNANCEDGNFMDANLSNGNFDGTVFSEAIFYRTDFSNASITNVNVHGAKFADAKNITKEMQASVKDFADEKLGGADWSKCAVGPIVLPPSETPWTNLENFCLVEAGVWSRNTF